MSSLPKAIFVRHSPSTGNRRHIMKGVEDYPPDAKGKREAKDLAKTIVRHKPTVVVTSPLSRATVLAKEIAKQGKIPLQVDPHFLPQDLGDWQGKPMEKYEPKLAKLAAEKPNEKVPGGESFNHFLKKKVRPGFAKVREMIKRGERPAIVTHSRDLRQLRYGLGIGKPANPSKGGPKPNKFVLLNEGNKISAGS